MLVFDNHIEHLPSAPLVVATTKASCRTPSLRPKYSVSSPSRLKPEVRLTLSYAERNGPIIDRMYTSTSISPQRLWLMSTFRF